MTMQIPKDQWYKVFETDEIIKAGTFTPDTDEELEYLRHYIYIQGTPAGTEKIRSIIYSDSTFSSILAASDWAELSDIEEVSHAYWQGFIRTDFNRLQLRANRDYYIAIEIDDYTRNSNTLYIAAKFDYDNSIYPNSSDQFTSYPIATEFYTYKEFEE